MRGVHQLACAREQLVRKLIANIKEAIALDIEVLQDRGESVPDDRISSVSCSIERIVNA
jgi:predicted RNase H-like HicB family nuclease